MQCNESICKHIPLVDWFDRMLVAERQMPNKQIENKRKKEKKNNESKEIYVEMT